MKTTKNQMAHTPAPWEASPLWDETGVTKNKVVHAPSAGQTWKSDTATICELPEHPLNRANARLIAAAPELLQVAERLADDCESMMRLLVKYADISCKGGIIESNLLKAREVIAKATK